MTARVTTVHVQEIACDDWHGVEVNKYGRDTGDAYAWINLPGEIGLCVDEACWPEAAAALRRLADALDEAVSP